MESEIADDGLYGGRLAAREAARDYRDDDRGREDVRAGPADAAPIPVLRQHIGQQA
jgi:hypothetical protein